PTASTSTPRVGSLQALELLRYAVNDVAGSATGSVVSVAGWLGACRSVQSVPVNRPVKSARTSKSNVVASLPGVGEPLPICPWPTTSTPPPPPPPPPVVAQLTEKVVVAVPPDGTVTVRGFAPLTAQFAARPESATVCSPAGP